MFCIIEVINKNGYNLAIELLFVVQNYIMVEKFENRVMELLLRLGDLDLCFRPILAFLPLPIRALE